jgi:hypothetical protein
MKPQTLKKKISKISKKSSSITRNHPVQMRRIHRDIQGIIPYLGSFYREEGVKGVSFDEAQVTQRWWQTNQVQYAARAK